MPEDSVSFEEVSLSDDSLSFEEVVFSEDEVFSADVVVSLEDVFSAEAVNTLEQTVTIHKTMLKILVIFRTLFFHHPIVNTNIYSPIIVITLYILQDIMSTAKCIQKKETSSNTSIR